MNLTWNGRFFLAIILLLYGIGILMVFDTSAAEIIEGEFARDWHIPFLKQFLIGIFSLITALFCYRIGLSQCLHHIPLLMGITGLFLVIVFIPSAVKGAHRWISLGGFHLQPSEFARLFYPPWILYLLRKKNLFWLWRFSGAMVPLFLILIEPDNGTALILFAALLTMLFLAKIPLRYWLIPMIGVIIVGGSCAMRMEHVKQRISVFLDPKSDLQGKGHQPYQAKIAVGSGGLFGRGFGNSLQKFRYLPEAKSDYIAAIIAEEYGFAGVVGIVALYMMLLLSGMRIAIESEDQDKMLLVSLMVLVLGMAAFINLGVGLGMLPSKGMNLPFISQGGSSLLASGAMVGFILSAAKQRMQHGISKEV